MAVLARSSITLVQTVDVESVTWYYKLQASTAAKPSKPTDKTPSGWTTTEPTYTEGSTNSLYTCVRTIYSDGTFDYSDVSLSTSYEAAKQAYTKSVAAQSTANTANNKIDNLEIGGRNLVRGSAKLVIGAGSWSTGTFRKSGTGLIETVDITGDTPVGGVTKAIKLTGTKVGTQIGVAQDAFPNPRLNTNMICTWWFKAPAGSTIKVQAKWANGDAGNDTKQATATGEWQKLSSMGVVKTALASISIAYAYYFPLDTADTCLICAPMLEYANRQSDWSPAPEDNEAIANAAMDSADGKSKVYHQNSQPSGTNHKVGDTWFDTDDGNKMYTWNGSSWAAEQFGVNAIKDLAITNAKIADATIQSAKIANLDVGKLTGGYIAAKHLTADNMQTGTLKAKNNNNTYWNLDTGEWQSHGEDVDVEYYIYDSEAGQTVTNHWTVDTDTNIDDGVFKVTGTHDGKTTQYATFGLNGSGNPDISLADDYDPFAYAGLELRGDRINGHVDIENVDTACTLTPISYMSPDELVLGGSEEVQYSGQSPVDTGEGHRTNRNALFLAGGDSVTPLSAIRFVENCKWENDGTGLYNRSFASGRRYFHIPWAGEMGSLSGVSYQNRGTVMESQFIDFLFFTIVNVKYKIAAKHTKGAGAKKYFELPRHPYMKQAAMMGWYGVGTSKYMLVCYAEYDSGSGKSYCVINSPDIELPANAVVYVSGCYLTEMEDAYAASIGD